ncbi:NADPH-dependent alcohol dehydrogenase [Ephemerocybe angulata]|uniref:alcohol dehydrogenase (NADP(+)) n=1 Tax=Ephemerocybe angulata TaxID=980116 RepID=A0A8H6M3J2_9AGAR|nr:NADPH-dependent alcohol dehydrogenase [Tulosesus angulatus]
MSSNTEIQWKGYAVHDTKLWDQFKVTDFEPKGMEDKDIDIKIEYCGVCGSDMHTITGGWGEVKLPLIAGHEIAGHVVRVGAKVTEFKVGDRVGVGAQVGSCYDCQRCKNGAENYCHKVIHTYNSIYPDGTVSQGGYATAIRANELFVFHIPDALPLDQAAPMLCAGITTYSPLRTNGAGPGKSVGVIGIGGLGHYALQFAKAMKSDKVVAFSHSENKKADALALGATDFVNTGAENWVKEWTDTLDIILCTVDVSQHIPLSDIFATLKVHGRCVMLALPDDALPPIHPFSLMASGVLLGGSHIGSKAEIVEMLDLAAKEGVKSYIEMLPMKEIGKAVQGMKTGKVRYRYVLKADI